MTILAALIESDDLIVMAADSYEMQYHHDVGMYLWDPAEKLSLRVVQTGTIVWGYTGPGEGAGDVFDAWIRAFPIHDWDGLESAAMLKVRAINAPVIDDRTKIINVLIGGYLDGVQRVTGINPLGRPIIPSARAVFVGAGGRELAAPAWLARSTNGESVDRDALRTSLDSLIDRVPALKGPVRRWELTPSAFKEIKDGPAGSRL